MDTAARLFIGGLGCRPKTQRVENICARSPIFLRKATTPTLHAPHRICSRFLVNIPPEETENTIRICFAVEQAHWHFTDFSMEENPKLPALNMKQLLVKMLNNYAPFKHLAKRADDIIQAFKVYKQSVPVFGGG